MRRVLLRFSTELCILVALLGNLNDEPLILHYTIFADCIKLDGKVSCEEDAKRFAEGQGQFN